MPSAFQPDAFEAGAFQVSDGVPAPGEPLVATGGYAPRPAPRRKKRRQEIIEEIAEAVAAEAPEIAQPQAVARKIMARRHIEVIDARAIAAIRAEIARLQRGIAELEAEEDDVEILLLAA